MIPLTRKTDRLWSWIHGRQFPKNVYRGCGHVASLRHNIPHCCLECGVNFPDRVGQGYCVMNEWEKWRDDVGIKERTKIMVEQFFRMMDDEDEPIGQFPITPKCFVILVSFLTGSYDNLLGNRLRARQLFVHKRAPYISCSVGHPSNTRSSSFKERGNPQCHHSNIGFLHNGQK